MIRVILDTNIYGLLAKDAERLKIVSSIKSKKTLVTYGFKIIRDELRNTPKKIKIEGKNLRIDLLNLYDEIVENHSLEFIANISKVADNYYKAYREFGGYRSKNEIIDDFLIVSCASINNLNIVVSNDEKTMLTENAIRSYNIINSVLNKKTPKFINFEKFKKTLRGEPNEFF